MPTVSQKVFRSPALQELQHRGFIYQASDLEALDTLMAEESITFYVGYDATAPSLHVGNLLTIMAARILHKHGHRPLILMGGGTTKVGDPSGKDQSRQMLSVETIQENIQTISKTFHKLFDDSLTIVNNDDWLSGLNYLEFLRDYGPHFTINRMLTFDMVRSRLERESPLTFLEFNYMLLQAYDFLVLSKSHNCLLQLGGSDQWGNLINGVELIRKTTRRQAFGLTIPLITTSGGAKMGKSAQGAVWLNAEMLSPYDYWQFWRNTEDQDVVRFMKYYTDLSLADIQAVEALEGSALNAAKVRLADAATQLLHGHKVLEEIHQTAQSLFQDKETPLEVLSVDAKGNAHLKSAIPILPLSFRLLDEKLLLLGLFKMTGLCSSNSEARRLIQGGGCRLNDKTITQEDAVLTAADLQAHNVVKLAVGKKKFSYLQFMKH